MRLRESRRSTAALALAAMWTLAAAPTFAERADRDKPVNIESNSMSADEAKRTATFEGKVVLTQGSLIIRAERIVVRQDNEGFQNGTATGNPATFRYKQEGNGGYIDAQAMRIEYDNRTGRVEFFEAARLHRDSGDDIRGDFISYDARAESFSVKSAGDREGRVSATIVPKKSAPAGPAEPSAGQRN